MTVFGH